MSREVRFINPRIIIGAVLIAIIVIAGSIIFAPKPTEFPLSDLERIMLDERSTKTVNYLEEIDMLGEIDKDHPSNPIVNEYPLDRYVAYALEYNYNENDKTELTTKEMETLLESIFDIDFDEEQINSVGISPLLLDKNIGHDPVSKVYSINKNYDKRQIANIPISKYIKKNAYTNKDKTVYTVVYDKYTAKSPYDILPHIEASGTKDYLEGRGKVSIIKNAINADNVKDITNPEKETTIEYVLKDDKILVKSIK